MAGSTGSKKKIDDNKILQEDGQEPLSKPQLAAFNKLFKAVFDKVTKEAASGGAAINIGMDGSVTCMAIQAVFEEDESAQQKFNQADTDTDDLLNKAEGVGFLKAVLEEGSSFASDDLLGLWADACGSLNTETGDKFSYPEFERSKKILTAWYDSPKAVDAALGAMDPQQAKMMRQMIEGGPEAMMGAIGSAMGKM